MAHEPVRFVVTWHDTAAACDATLWQSGFPAPLEGRWWYEALEQSGLEDQFTFSYAQVHDADGRARALAPCFLMEVPLEMFVPPPLVPLLRPLGKLFPALLHQRTLFVGSPCADRGWIGMDPSLGEPEVEAVLLVLDQAARARSRALGAPMRVWKDLPHRFADVIGKLAPRLGLFRVVSFPATYVALPAGGVDAYLKAMKPSRRQKLKRRLRISHAAVALDCSVVAAPDADQLAVLFGLFWQTYEHATTRFERLTPDFFRAMAALPMVRFIVLRETLERQPVAFMMVYIEGPILVNKFIGIDYQRPRDWMLYFRLWEAAVQAAIDFGLEGIESGQTGYNAKVAVGHTLIPLDNFCQHANPLLQAIYAWVGRRISWSSLDPELAALHDAESGRMGSRQAGSNQ